MAFESWKGQNFWSNFILVSMIFLEFVLFIVPDKQIAMWIIIGWVTFLLILKSQIELKFYKSLTGTTFLLGHTIWDKALNEEMEFGIKKKMKYENYETLTLYDHPKVEDEVEKEKIAKNFHKKKPEKVEKPEVIKSDDSTAEKTNETKVEKPEKEKKIKAEEIAFELEEGHTLYECILLKECEYEFPITKDESELITYDRIFLELPDEWDKCFDYGAIDWILDYYIVELTGAYVILQKIGWIMGKNPMFKLRYSDKIGIEEMDKFASQNTEIHKIRELTLSKIIKKQQSDMIIFEEEKEKLEIEIERQEDEIDSLKLKLKNAVPDDIHDPFKGKFYLNRMVAYILMGWAFISPIIIGIIVAKGGSGGGG